MSNQAVIFDMDGVIVDSEPLHEQAFLEVFKEIGYGETHGINFKEYYGKADHVIWRDFTQRHKPDLPLQELVALKRRRFLDILANHEPIYDGMPKLVERLAPQFSLGVASGSPHPIIDAVLAIRNLRRFFPVVVSAEDVARGKPSPDIFLRAAELLRIEPACCWVIEDSVAGVDAALAAGMRVIGITNSLSAEDLSRATYIVSPYEEVNKLLQAERSWHESIT